MKFAFLQIKVATLQAKFTFVNQINILQICFSFAERFKENQAED